MTTERVRAAIDKRLTLNWLIQGAAQHAGMTFQHVVAAELAALDPQLLPLYDLYALTNQLQRWQPRAVQVYGSPEAYWSRARTDPSHPFFGHPLLPAHGGTLAERARRRALERSRDKGLPTDPEAFVTRVSAIRAELRHRERPHGEALVALATRTTATIWGIPEARLSATLGEPVPFGTPIRILTPAAARFASAMAGLGGVERRGATLQVVGMGRNWHLLTKELVKGTAELICMHGAHDLSEEEYLAVAQAADRIEHERWMLQGGGELWRQLLAVVPPGRPIAEVLMHLARLAPTPLHQVLAAVLTQPDLAAEILATLGEAPADPASG